MQRSYRRNLPKRALPRFLIARTTPFYISGTPNPPTAQPTLVAPSRCLSCILPRIPSLLAKVSGGLCTACCLFRRASGRGWVAAGLSDIGPSDATPRRRAITWTALVATGSNGLTCEQAQSSNYRKSPHHYVQSREGSKGNGQECQAARNRQRRLTIAGWQDRAGQARSEKLRRRARNIVSRRRLSQTGLQFPTWPHISEPRAKKM
jgi:hypothetical protein